MTRGLLLTKLSEARDRLSDDIEFRSYSFLHQASAGVRLQETAQGTRFKKGQSGNPAGRSKGKDKLTEPGEVFADVMGG
jgi:Family of unknown function (DUF5681)